MSPTPNPSPEPRRPEPFTVIREVRYSLPELLQELKGERASSAFGMEKLDQTEIGKLFKAKPTRRVKSKQ